MIKPDTCGCLFIFYGLLKNGADNGPTHIPLMQAGEHLGPCRFLGRMFDAGGYPGVRDGEGVCEGELYRLDDMSILPAMDEFEDCDMGDPDGSLYQRKRVAFFNGPSEMTTGEAWVYWYTGDSTHLPVIPSGRWTLTGGVVEGEAKQYEG